MLIKIPVVKAPNRHLQNKFKKKQEHKIRSLTLCKHQTKTKCSGYSILVMSYTFVQWLCMSTGHKHKILSIYRLEVVVEPHTFSTDFSWPPKKDKMMSIGVVMVYCEFFCDSNP